MCTEPRIWANAQDLNVLGLELWVRIMRIDWTIWTVDVDHCADLGPVVSIPVHLHFELVPDGDVRGKIVAKLLTSSGDGMSRNFFLGGSDSSVIGLGGGGFVGSLSFRGSSIIVGSSSSFSFTKLRRDSLTVIELSIGASIQLNGVGLRGKSSNKGDSGEFDNSHS